MQIETDILALLEAKGAQVAKEAQRAVILQPGALGDCILTLPLVKLMKDKLNLGGVDIIGHTEYTGIFPGRTCVDGVRSIDSTELHRMFVEPAKFDLVDWDPLINTFAAYSWIVTFLGEPGGNFEQNLIFTANCSHSAEIITLSMKPPEDAKRHVADFYIQQFAGQSGLPPEQAEVAMNEVLIRVTEADRDYGVELLDQAEIDLSRKLVVIHPGSGGQKKCWHLENFVSLAQDLLEQELEVMFLLGPAEMERLRPADEAHLYGAARCMGHLSLAQVLGLLSCADAFVGNDSGVSHLAAGMGLRTYVVFGPTDPALYRPIGPAVTVFQDAQETFAEKPSPDFQKKVLAAVASIV